MSKPVIPRQLAVLDAEQAVDYYLTENAPQAALGFIDALAEAYEHIARHPASGSLRYAYELGLPDLRSHPLRTYPHLVFYMVQKDHVDVWRVLHGQRDMPAWIKAE